MNTLVVLLTVLCLYAVAYRYYSAFLAARARYTEDCLAEAVAAGVRQIDAGAQAGVENGLAFGHFDLFANGIDGKLVNGHAGLPWRLSPACCSACGISWRSP